jgi:hypothetical protein
MLDVLTAPTLLLRREQEELCVIAATPASTRAVMS